MSSREHYLLKSLNILVLYPITYLCRILLVLIVVLFARRYYVSARKKKRVTVVVLGDIGRSPRMQYHALSLADHGFTVDIVGYTDSKPKEKILASPLITLHGLVKAPASRYFPRIIAYAVKFIVQTLILSAKLMLKVEASEFILMQNPPCIPTMLVCWIVSIFNGSKLIIDWHNYGYTILGLTLGHKHKLVRIAHAYEKILGQLAKSEICVTKAMQKDLEDNWHIHAVVLYDRPFENFKPLNLEDKHNLFTRLKEEYDVFGSDEETSSTFCTSMRSGIIEERRNRPALIISSTSWTEDEDFSILLNALKKYDENKRTAMDMPDLICAITGKGPMKEFYMKEIEKQDWEHVSIVTPWLSAEDYPLLIGSADIGVCLHTSSSGLDLPMKVVDMFGCGVPVLAIDFNCLGELVQDGENGIIFQNENDLHKKLVTLLTGFPQKRDTLNKMRQNLETFRKSTWTTNWEENVLPLFEQ